MQEESEFLEASTISALENQILDCFEVDPSHLPRAKAGIEIPLKKNLKLDRLSACTDCEYRSAACSEVSGMPLSLRKVSVAQKHHMGHQKDIGVLLLRLTLTRIKSFLSV